MAKKEVKTDYWVSKLLEEADIVADAQGSDNAEVNKALSTASKSKTGNVGFPEFVAIVKDYVIVIEDKSTISRHEKLNEDGIFSSEIKDIKDYALNGAIFYAKHIVNNSHFKKAFAIGVSGNEKNHRITPVFIEPTEYIRVLDDVESFVSFNENNIDEYYVKDVLKEDTILEKDLVEVLKDAAAIHEDLRTYGSLLEEQKPLIISGILLALREKEFKNFDIDNLTGDQVNPDGKKIYEAIEDNLKRSNVAPEVKKDKVLNQFVFIKNNTTLNSIHPKLNKTPLKYFCEQVNEKIYKSIRYTQGSEDYIGRFYGEFMSYSGGDGQSLGIILTPKHITDLFCELLDIQPDDVIIDPCCGTAGFLIAAMHHMLQKATSDQQRKDIRMKQLHGFEVKENMFTIATTNMILRGDGKSNLIYGDFLAQKPKQLQLKGATVGMMNPPYSQGSKSDTSQYEINFIEHLLDSLLPGGRAAIIVPQSTMTGKTEFEAHVKKNLLKHHTLEGVISLSKDTFYGVGTIPCIAIFTAGEPHPLEKEVKFINFEKSGWVVAPHLGLKDDGSAKDKKQHLLDVWFNRIEDDTKFCVKSKITPDDEWLHSYFYFNDEIPSDSEFEKAIGDYLTFEFSMIMQNREYLFSDNGEKKDE